MSEHRIETKTVFDGFHSASWISGCSCGFQANTDADNYTGDTVVEHLLAAGRAERDDEVASLREALSNATGIDYRIHA